MSVEPNQQIVWADRYHAGHTPWDRGDPSPALAKWLPALKPPPAQVLVPACGRGHEVIALCRMGYEVTAIDIVPGVITDLHRQLKATDLSADTQVADLLTWEPTPGNTFELIYEQTALCALPPAQWQVYTTALARWLQPGGLLLGLFMQTGRPGGPPWHCDLLTLQRLFPVTRWYWPENLEAFIAHPSGLKELALVLQRH
jgi:SAM-dependent methyltransferase